MKHFLLSTLVASLLGAAGCPAAETLSIYVGTYTGPKSKGIYILRMDPATGRLSNPTVAAEVKNPSYLTFDPNGRFAYAVSELWGPGNGAVSAFAVEPSGQLKLLNQQSSGGKGPCFVTVDPSGRNALVANYGSGTLAVLPIGANGRLAEPSCTIQHRGKGPNPKRQEGPHAHSINLDPTGRIAFAADLGLDKLFIYRLDPAKGTLIANDPPFAAVAPGAGPRHFTFHPNGKFAYVINEMGCTITAFAYDPARGALSEIQSIPTLPADFKGESTTAEIRIHPSGKFLYGSNRGHNSLAIYGIDDQTGKLSSIGYEPTRGKTPRNFNIDPAGRFLVAANQDSDNLAVFSIDPASGKLSFIQTVDGIGSPVCVKFLPATK